MLNDNQIQKYFQQQKNLNKYISAKYNWIWQRLLCINPRVLYATVSTHKAVSIKKKRYHTSSEFGIFSILLFTSKSLWYCFFLYSAHNLDTVHPLYKLYWNGYPLSFVVRSLNIVVIGTNIDVALIVNLNTLI